MDKTKSFLTLGPAAPRLVKEKAAEKIFGGLSDFSPVKSGFAGSLQHFGLPACTMGA